MVRYNDPYSADAMQGVKLRAQVHQFIGEDVGKAYRTANTIRHPWYRCQALANITSAIKKNKLNKILKQSFDSAMACHDQNRRVTVACWPLSVAIQREADELAKQFLTECEHQIHSDFDVISRWCAASVLFTIKAHLDLRYSFFETFSDATSKGHGWKVERTIKRMLQDEDIKQDHRYIKHLENRQTAIALWKKDNLNHNKPFI